MDGDVCNYLRLGVYYDTVSKMWAAMNPFFFYLIKSWFYQISLESDLQTKFV